MVGGLQHQHHNSKSVSYSVQHMTAKSLRNVYATLHPHTESDSLTHTWGRQAQNNWNTCSSSKKFQAAHLLSTAGPIYLIEQKEGGLQEQCTSQGDAHTPTTRELTRLHALQHHAQSSMPPHQHNNTPSLAQHPC